MWQVKVCYSDSLYLAPRQLNYIQLYGFSPTHAIGEIFVWACESAVKFFPADNYWSSTENSATNACNQNFNNGNINNNNKTNTNRVRAVRRFNLCNFIATKY